MKLLKYISSTRWSYVWYFC